MPKNDSVFVQNFEKESPASPSSTLDNFEILYIHYASKIHRKCLIMTNNDEDAKDFTQDIFLKVFTKLHTFQNRAAFSTWLYAVAHNYCLDQLRLSKRFSQESLSEDLIGTLADHDQLDPIVNQMHILELNMSELPTQELAILRLKHEQGLSVKAISQQYDLSESAVKMRLKRTRDKLQTLCTNY